MAPEAHSGEEIPSTNMEVDNVTKDHGPHPDAEALRNWTLYGPQNPNIANLVQQLANEQHMRLSKIENLIENAMEEQLRKPQTSQSWVPNSN